MVPDIGEADVDCRILLRKRVLRPLDILCHVPPQAVRIDEIDLHTGRVEDLTGPILRFIRLTGNFQRDRRPEGHELRAVVLEIHHAIGIYDRRADCILRVLSAGRKEDIGRIHAGFLRDIVCTRLPCLVLQDAELAGRIIVDEIDIDIAGRLFIGRRENAGGLRIALRLDTVGDRVRRKIHNCKTVAAVLAELRRTSDADVGTAIVHHRR